MTVHIVNYGSNEFMPMQRYQNNQWRTFHPEVIIHSFVKQDLAGILQSLDTIDTAKIRDVLTEPKGDGLWAWKIPLIYAVFNKAQKGDIIFYLDSGCCLEQRIDYIFAEIRAKGSLFCKVSGIEDEEICRKWLLLQFPERKHLIETANLFSLEKWDKRRIAQDLDPGAGQVAAGLQGWRVSEENNHILRDLLLQITRENYDDTTAITSSCYIEHRHDQSVLSALVYRYALPIRESVPGIVKHKNSFLASHKRSTVRAFLGNKKNKIVKLIQHYKT